MWFLAWWHLMVGTHSARGRSRWPLHHMFIARPSNVDRPQLIRHHYDSTWWTPSTIPHHPAKRMDSTPAHGCITQSTTARQHGNSTLRSTTHHSVATTPMLPSSDHCRDPVLPTQLTEETPHQYSRAGCTMTLSRPPGPPIQTHIELTSQPTTHLTTHGACFIHSPDSTCLT